MTHLIGATLEIGYFDARPAYGEIPARVSFDDAGMTLAVPAGEHGEATLYQGQRRGQGHYVLNAPEMDAGATLHRFAGSTILEGFWRSAGDRGFWRLHLPVESVLTAQERPAAKRSRPPRGAVAARKTRLRRASAPAPRTVPTAKAA